MNTPSLPDARSVLSDLRVPLRRIVEALQLGVSEARSYFLEHRREPIDRNLFPDLVRYHVKQTLQRAGHEAEEDPDPGEFQERAVARNGLVVSAGQYELRILKSDRGALPRPHSDARLAFYNQDRWRAEQTSLLDREETKGQSRPRRILGLVALWDVTPAQELANVFLVCPRACTQINGFVMESWSEPLFVVGQTATYDFSSGQAAPEDLDITRKGERKLSDLESAAEAEPE